MKTFILLFVIFQSANCLSQSPAGIWRSEDSTRTYIIIEESNGIKVLLSDSKRKGEESGKIITDKLGPTNNKKAYRGTLYAVADGTPVSCKAMLSKDGNTLQLKLRRMFFFPVTICWYRISLTTKSLL